METKQFSIGNKGLLVFGVILLLIGLVASFYVQVETFTTSWGEVWEVGRNYPYQGIGIVLVLAGIIFVAIGFFYSPRKSQVA